MSRVGIGGLWHETNTYSARLTDLEAFRAFEYLVGEEIVTSHRGTGTVIGGMLQAESFDPVPIMTAGAWPAGRVTWSALDKLFGRFDAELRKAGPLDGLLLDLHGSMVGEGVDDVEQATLTLVREVAGEIPVVAVHDLHGNPSPALAARCNALVAYDTFPHVDMHERGQEAAELLGEILAGARFRTMVHKIPLLVSPLAQATATPPMRDLKAHAAQLEAQSGIRRISLLPGFQYADVARAGFSVVVVYEEGSEEKAQFAGGELADEIEGLREEWVVRRPDPSAAVAEAIRSPDEPVILVDVADNIGGGSPGDGTALLAELLAQRAQGAVVSIADPEVAQAAARVGEGGTVAAEVGGKTDRRHGEPIHVQGRVLRLSDGRYLTEGSWQTGREFAMGTTAVIEVDGVTLVVMERPTPPFHGEQLTSVGIDPGRAAIIVAKGAIAWRAAYGDVAGRVIEVDGPGICPVDPSRLERSTTPMRV